MKNTSSLDKQVCFRTVLGRTAKSTHLLASRESVFEGSTSDSVACSPPPAPRHTLTVLHLLSNCDICQFSIIAGNVYPEAYERFVSNLNPINLDICLFMSYSCIVTTNFYDRLLIATIGPLLVLAVLAGTYAIAKKRNGSSELAVRAVQRKHLSAALFILFFIYASVSFTIFQTFVCEKLDDGETYLRSDYSLTCTTNTYRAYKAYAILMVCVYPVGIPAAFTWWLARNRQVLNKPNRETLENLEPLKDLWAAYKPSRYYYEVIECGRRIILTGIAVFILPDSAAQIAVVLLLAVVFLFISESLSPFKTRVDMRLYRWGNGIVLASMYVALLLKVDVSAENGDNLYAFSVVLIVAHVFMVVTVIIQSLLLLKNWRAKTSERVNPVLRGSIVLSMLEGSEGAETEESGVNVLGRSRMGIRGSSTSADG